MDVRGAWKNAYYRVTMIYIAVIVTISIGLHVYEYFASTSCANRSQSILTSIAGVIFNA